MTRIIYVAMVVSFSCFYLSGCGKSKGEQAKEQWNKEIEKYDKAREKPTQPMWK